MDESKQSDSNQKILEFWRGRWYVTTSRVFSSQSRERDAIAHCPHVPTVVVEALGPRIAVGFRCRRQSIRFKFNEVGR